MDPAALNIFCTWIFSHPLSISASFFGMEAPKIRINDFSIHVATVNGSGSQSSNQILLRSLFRMGIPVSGKNLFPSNIQGLPTWFTIRVNDQGWVGRKTDTEILVCMNDQTYVDDVKELKTGAIVIHHDHMDIPAIRSDVVSLKVPFSKIIAEACPDPRLRKMAVNMVYVGVLAELLGITPEAIDLAMKQQFKTKQKVIDLNQAALVAGRSFVQKESSNFKIPYRVEARNLTQGKILIEGNAASALGSVFSGCTFVSWYPITPSSSVIDYFSEYAEKYRVDPKTGEKNFVVAQAEDELAACGMVLGASWMGARAMTATSGPGISLMAEFAGYGYFAELPAVIYDIQRVGPSTGLPTRTAQGDVLFAATLSHGDTKHLCLYPGDVTECYEFAGKAFDLAERFQTPVFVLSDLDIGMNTHMADPFPYLDQAWDRGKVLTAKDKDKLATFFRYEDPDQDGVPYRTLPGNPEAKSVYFTRGSGHNAKGAYSEKGADYVQLMNRLAKKFETAKKFVPEVVSISGSGKNKVGVICYGSSGEPCREAAHLLKTEAGLDIDFIRIRAYPFTETIKDFIRNHEKIYVVDQNRDGQMLALLKIEADLKKEVPKLESILHYDGLPLCARTVVDQILKLEQASQKAA